MNRRPDPILTYFAVPPSTGNAGPSLVVDPSTGLLHDPGNTVPFVETLIEIGGERRSLAHIDTIATESYSDPPDPDLVRADSPWLRFGEALTTTLTKMPEDPEDPDLVRVQSLRWFVDGISTTLTEAGEEPDPDLVRVGHTHGPQYRDA